MKNSWIKRSFKIKVTFEILILFFKDQAKLLMQGIELSQQERECKLYNELDSSSKVYQVLQLLGRRGKAMHSAKEAKELSMIDDLDAFNSNCIEALGAKAVLMANLSCYDSTIILEEKENQENDKIGSKPDKNGKRVKAGKSLKQLQ
nr:hypothetical protein [Tanacetum cinerariifolium]